MPRMRRPPCRKTGVHDRSRRSDMTPMPAEMIATGGASAPESRRTVPRRTTSTCSQPTVTLPSTSTQARAATADRRRSATARFRRRGRPPTQPPTGSAPVARRTDQNRERDGEAGSEAIRPQRRPQRRDGQLDRLGFGVVVCECVDPGAGSSDIAYSGAASSAVPGGYCETGPLGESTTQPKTA